MLDFVESLDMSDSAGPRAPRGFAATTWGPGRLDLFWVDDDRALWHQAWVAGAWVEPEPLEGELASGPTVVAWGADRLDVFARGTDGRTWHRWWDGAQWVPWEQL
jgi:hypothetical protein